MGAVAVSAVLQPCRLEVFGPCVLRYAADDAALAAALAAFWRHGHSSRLRHHRQPRQPRPWLPSPMRPQP
jgi:hypothetical protein